MHERIVVRARGTGEREERAREIEIGGGGRAGEMGVECNSRARGGVRTERAYPVLLVGDGVVSEGMIPPKREAPEARAPDTPKLR